MESEGGLVDAALGNAVHIQLARARGAHIRDNVKVLDLRPTQDGGCQVLVRISGWTGPPRVQIPGFGLDNFYI